MAGLGRRVERRSAWRERLQRYAAAFRRAVRRQAAHARRGLAAVGRVGPGRLAGVVLRCDADGDEVVITGWAHLRGHPIELVVVAVDGRTLGVASPNERTPELPGTGPVTHRSSFAGWTVVAPRSAVGAGPVVVTAVAVLGRGLTEALLPLTVDVPPPPTPPPPPPMPIGMLDVPADGAGVEPPHLWVAGWLLDGAGFDRVEVTIGEGPPIRARLYSFPRPDVAALSDDPSAAMSGWEATIDLPRRSEFAGPLTVTAVARGAAGDVTLGAARVVVAQQDSAATPDVAWYEELAARANLAARPVDARSDGLRLAVFTHHLGLGGGQLYLQDLLRHLLAGDDVACLVVSPTDGVLRHELEDLGASVHVAGPYPIGAAAYESRVRELAALCRDVDANAVLANTAGTFIGVDVADRCGIPALWAIHESYTLDGFFAAAYGDGADDYVRARAARALGTAAGVIFEADATRRLYEQHGDPRRFIRLHYGIPLADVDAYRSSHDREAIRSRHQFGCDEVVILCMGTYEPRKAQVPLLLAFSRLADDFPNARLVLVGDTGTPHASGVHRVAQALELGARARLLGVTPDVYEWYLAADVFVTASDVESLPRSVLEVMAFEVPVVAASVFGLPELIRDGVDGLLFESLDIGSLTTALRRVLTMSAEEREVLGRAAGDRVRPARDAGRFADAYRRLFDVLLVNPDAYPGEVLDSSTIS